MPLPDLQHILGLIEAGQTREALGLLEQLVEQAPSYAAARVVLARTYEFEGQWRASFDAWQGARFFAPESPVIAAGLRRAATALAQPSPAPAPPITPALTVDAPTAPPPDPRTTAPAAEAPAPAPPPAAEVPTPEAPAPEAPVSEAPAAEAPAERPAEGPAFEDLDRLIEELETARIVPAPDLDDLPAPDLDDEIDDMVSETLARIYETQQQYEEAARVYEKLAEQQPGRADEYRRKADALRTRAGQ